MGMRSAAFPVLAAVLVVCGGTLLPCASVNASGRTPPLPLAEERFNSQDACAAHLEALHAKDKATADPEPVAGENGETRQRIVRSEGVQRIDERNAHYSVHVGNQIRAPLPDLHMLRTSYSYEERTTRCIDGLLTGESAMGHYQEGYAPIGK